MIKSKLVFLIIIFLLVCGAGVYLWLIGTGRIKTGAEVITGCQGSNQISAFMGKPGANIVSNNFFGHDISVNQIVVPYLDNIEKEMQANKINYDFRTIFGYVNRSKIGGGGKSLHSWGIAIDINPDANPYQPGNYGPPTTDMPQEMIEIFRKNGFIWGGDWPGERDAMHFEWYGARVSGSVIDKTSSQKVPVVATFIDGAGSPNENGSYSWIMPFGSHILSSKAKGYQNASLGVSLACFSDNSIDIAMEALAANTAGSISGHIAINSYPILMPANIYLDDRPIGVSNLKGDYYIPNVREGKHKVEARVLFFPSSSETVNLTRGENLEGVDISIGK